MGLTLIKLLFLRLCKSIAKVYLSLYSLAGSEPTLDALLLISLCEHNIDESDSASAGFNSQSFSKRLNCT